MASERNTRTNIGIMRRYIYVLYYICIYHTYKKYLEYVIKYWKSSFTYSYNDEANRASRYCRPQAVTLASKAMVNNAANASQGQQMPTKTGGTPLGVGSRSGRSYLERMVSAPLLNTQPKSCLSRKSCLHKCNQSSSPKDPAPTEDVDVVDSGSVSPNPSDCCEQR